MRRRYWIALGVVAVAVVGAGSAVAATKLMSPSERSTAIISDAAGRLHVSPGALSAALEKALDDQIDAAVAAGRLTKAQGDALKARINAGQVPLMGGFGYGYGDRDHFGPGFGHVGGMFGAGLHAVTSYLGITPAQLRSELMAGKSLAQIAKEHGKTADGLVAALDAVAKSRLDQAVTAKRISAAQEQAILGKLHNLFEMLVNRTLPPGMQGMLHPGFGFHRHGSFGMRPQF